MFFLLGTFEPRESPSHSVASTAWDRILSAATAAQYGQQSAHGGGPPTPPTFPPNNPAIVAPALFYGAPWIGSLAGC